MLDDYRQHAAERAAQGLPPKPLNARWTCELVEWLKNPPAGAEAFLLDLLTHRVPAGVDEAAYVKAAFLAAVAKGEAHSPILDPVRATELLGTMLGGYNVAPLVELLDHPQLGPVAARGLSHTLLVFDAFHDVQDKAAAGNRPAQAVLRSWAEAEWFTARPPVAERITVIVFKVPGKSPPTTCPRPRTPGRARTSPCTPRPC